MPKGHYESQFRKNSGRVNGHRPSVEDRFWQKVDRDGPIMRPDLGPCWEWTGARFRRPNGAASYGQFQFEGRPHNAHRVAWTLVNGPIATGQRVLHHCDNEGCVRPDHLFVGTDSLNMRDMVAKGRARPFRGGVPGDRNGSRAKPQSRPRGEKHSRAQLTDQQVTEMRALHREGFSQVDLTRRYGVTKGTVSKIVNRQTWKHLP